MIFVSIVVQFAGLALVLFAACAVCKDAFSQCFCLA